MSFESRLIVIADPDGAYIKGFEEELLKRLDPTDTVQVITETDYLMEFFSVRRSIDALIIAQEFIGNYLQDHDIQNLMILESRQDFGFQDEDAEQKLLRYVGHEDILRFVDRCFSDLDEPDDYDDGEFADGSDVKVVAVYSPIGGSGKSLTALALGKKLKMLEEKVLVIGCDPLQSIGVFLESREYADESLAELLKHPSENTYWTVLKNISQENVPCLLPFEKPLFALGLGLPEIRGLVEMLREKKDFSYIILDLGTAFDEYNIGLIEASDLCVAVTEPNVDSARKLEKINRNRRFLPSREFVTLVNQYHSDGLVLDPEHIFGSFRAYGSAREAMDDPVFYRLAMKIAGESPE